VYAVFASTATWASGRLVNLQALHSPFGMLPRAGTALLMLASHSQCGSSSHLACFSSFAMRVKKCNIKAWPHQAHKSHKPCMGIRLLANVTGWFPRSCLSFDLPYLLQFLALVLALCNRRRRGTCSNWFCVCDDCCCTSLTAFHLGAGTPSIDAAWFACLQTSTLHTAPSVGSCQAAQAT
jgi:hypothetical protein